MEKKFALTPDQVRKFEKACARNDLQMRHFLWMVTGDNLRPVKGIADDEVEPLVFKPKRDAQGQIQLDTIKVGKGKDLAIASQIKQEGRSRPHPKYRAEVNPEMNIVELTTVSRCLISPSEIDVSNFPYAHEEDGFRDFALVEVTDPDFSGVSGPTDDFVLEKFQTIRIRPATFLELVSFGAHLRKLHANDWHWGKTIVALGSAVTVRRTCERPGFFASLFSNPFRRAKPDCIHFYPCLDCGGGREFDAVRMTSCEKGPWPATTHLFLGVHL